MSVGGWMGWNWGIAPKCPNVLWLTVVRRIPRRHGVSRGGGRGGCRPYRREDGYVRGRRSLGWALGKGMILRPIGFAGNGTGLGWGNGGCCLSGQLLHYHDRVWLPM